MAELNIKRISTYNSNITKDKRGCYKRGDIIEVMDDGEYDDKAHITVLVVKDLWYTKAQKLVEPLVQVDEDTQESIVQTRRKLNIPESIMSKLFPDGVYRTTIDKETFFTYLDDVFDKETKTAIKNCNYKTDLITEMSIVKPEPEPEPIKDEVEVDTKAVK